MGKVSHSVEPYASADEGFQRDLVSSKLDRSFMSKEDAGVEKLKSRLLNMAIETISAEKPSHSAHVSIREAEELLQNEYGVKAGELIIENDRLKTTIQRMGQQMQINPTNHNDVVDRLRHENKKLRSEH